MADVLYCSFSFNYHFPLKPAFLGYDAPLVVKQINNNYMLLYAAAGGFSNSSGIIFSASFDSNYRSVLIPFGL